MQLLIHAGIKVNLSQLMGPQVLRTSYARFISMNARAIQLYFKLIITDTVL